MNSRHESFFAGNPLWAQRGFALLFVGCVAFAGCGKDAGTPVETFMVTGAPIAGKLLTGTLPVSGAHVYLMAVAATGYGKPSVSLLESGSTGSQDSTGAYVLTAADGSFTVPGYYSCSAQTEVYLYTSGGDSGLGQNSAATELAAIGPCPAEQAQVAPVMVNEATTVAMSFGLAGFANDALHVASSGSPLALTGLTNAFVNAAHLVPATTGVAAAMLPSGAATVPQATINTLANILFACVHSTGASSAACQALLGTAGSAPPSTDTASAMIALAHSPANGVATLFAQQPPTPPYTPALTAAPNDFSLGLVFIDEGISQTDSMAVDAMGNVWSTNFNTYYVTEISGAGVLLSGATGYVAPDFAAGPIAVDLNGNVWIGQGSHTFSGPGSLVELSSSGSVLSGVNGYGYGVLGTPRGLAIDASNNIWVADTVGDDVAEFSSSGQVLSGTKGFTGGGISNPYQLAIAPSGNIWITNSTTPSISALSSSGAPLTPTTGVVGTGFVGATALAIDHESNVWGIATGPSAQVSEVSESGALLSGSGYATSVLKGVEGAVGIAIDGDGNTWTPSGFPTVVELSNAGSILSGNEGYGGGLEPGAQYLVIDGSGDTWVSNATYTPPKTRGAAGVYTWRITEMIGIAAPVVTPIAAGVKLNMLGARP